MLLITRIPMNPLRKDVTERVCSSAVTSMSLFNRTNNNNMILRNNNHHLQLLVRHSKEQRQQQQQQQKRYFSTTVVSLGNDNEISTNNRSSNQTKKKTTKKKYSLAFSALFCVPELGMKEYEVLSRATAFLLAVDPKDAAYDDEDPFFRDDDDDDDDNDGTGKKKKKNPYKHLETAELKRQIQIRRDVRGGYSGVSSADSRQPIDFNWLEFVPREVRPRVHIVTSSHVVSPFLWREYYNQNWLTKVQQKHVSYIVEVIDTTTNNNTVLVKLPINSNPYHHPEGRDIALLHFREERSTLDVLHKYGIRPLYLRDCDKRPLKHNEQVVFDGYAVKVPDDDNDDDSKNKSSNNDNNSIDFDDHYDDRIFVPQIENGLIVRNINDCIYAKTIEPLSEGLCGAPVIDIDHGECCGCVEGIVPVSTSTTTSTTSSGNQQQQQLAGCAAFIPNYAIKPFIDYVERGMLEQIMPKDLFKMCEQFKRTNTIDGGFFMKDTETGKHTEQTRLDHAYDQTIEEYKKLYGEDELNTTLLDIRTKREEILNAFGSDANREQDLQTFIEHYLDQSKANELRQLVQMRYSKHKQQERENERKKNIEKTSTKNQKQQQQRNKMDKTTTSNDDIEEEERTRY